jgi:hypothetical protein
MQKNALRARLNERLDGARHSCATSAADMNEGRPSRGRYSLFAKFGDGSVQRVSDVVQVERVPCKKGFVKPAGHIRSVLVVHHPAGVHISAGINWIEQNQVLTTSCRRRF